MDLQTAVRRRIVTFSSITVAALAILLLSRVVGWRAGILARFQTNNPPVVVSPPANFQPQVPSGFRVSVFARGFTEPRWLAVAPNRDVFVADSAIGKVVVLYDPQGHGSVQSREVFADHLNLPFGIAFHDDFVYGADTNEVLRFRYDPRTSKRLGDAESILDPPGMGDNQHWTRSLAFSPNGRRLFVSVGSCDNISIESDPRRAAILVADPDGKNLRMFASGLRNTVGITSIRTGRICGRR